MVLIFQILCVLVLLALAHSFINGASPLRKQKTSNPRASEKLQMGIDLSGPYWKITLNTKESFAEIAAHGACVTSFKVQGQEYLFVRPDSVLDGSKPISGGVPLCWPQFGPGAMQQHGFARNSNFELMGMTYPNSTSDIAAAEFLLESNKETKAMWDHDFQLWYTVTLSPSSLNLKMTVRNTGSKEFDFTGALHSYFGVSSIENAVVHGPFKGAPSIDKTVKPLETKAYQGEEVVVTKETDCIFGGVKDGVSLVDNGTPPRRLLIKNIRGFADTVVWNPFGKKEMGADKFICVEAGNIMDSVKVKPGGKWVGEMELVPEKV